MVAAQNGHCTVVGRLLEAKADVNIRSNVSDIYWLCLCTSNCIVQKIENDRP